MKSLRLTKVFIIGMMITFSLQINATIKEVVVFTDRALITRELNTDAVEGVQELTFENIPLNTDLATLRAKGFAGEGGGIKILDIQVEKNFEATVSRDKLEKLEDDLLRIDTEIKRIGAERSRLNKQKSMLDILLNNSQIKNSDDLSKGNFSVDQWQKAYAYYIDQTQAIDNKLLTLENDTREIREERAKIAEELSQYNQVKSNYTLDVIVSYEMKKATEVSLILNYITPNAGWYSLYDCRVDLDEQQVVMGYYAKVYQDTGESWDNVDLILSTARPDLSGTVPQLSAWLISYYDYSLSETVTYSRDKSSYRSKMEGMESEDYFYDDDLEAQYAPLKEEKEKEVINVAKVESQGVNVQYRIAKKSTIPVGNKEIKVTVASEIPLKTDFSWEIVPRYDQNAFIKGTIHNTTDFTFLPGETALFVNDSFIGNSSIGLINTTQEFELSLGRDPRITSEFKLVDSEHGNKLKKVTEKRTYEITVYNNAKEDITFSIKDILPKSIYPKKIAVKILKIEPEPKDIDQESIYTWEITVKKGESITITEQWEIEYPEELTIQGL